MRLTHMLIAASASAALLAGCGSSSSSSSTGATTTAGAGATTSSAASSTPLTPAAWKQKIDGICAGVTAETTKFPKPTAAADVPGFLQKIVGAGNAEIAQINAVVPPAQYAAGQKQVTSDLTEIYSRLQQLLDRHLSGAALAAAFKSYPASVEKPARDYLAQSRAAGLKNCVLSSGG